MKKLLLGLCLSILSINSFAQDLEFDIRGKYMRPVSQDVLEQSQLLSDIIADYPVNWIKDYVSVEVLTEKKGKRQIAKGSNLLLNAEQKTILRKVDLESEVEINIWYKTENSVTGKTENNQMIVKMTVVPDIEAEYVGGYAELKKYLKDNLIDRIAENTPEEFHKGKVTFTIDISGKLIDAEVSTSSGDKDLDDFFLEIFSNMPNWKPAQNSSGEKVIQRFEFSMGIVKMGVSGC